MSSLESVRPEGSSFTLSTIRLNSHLNLNALGFAFTPHGRVTNSSLDAAIVTIPSFSHTGASKISYYHVINTDNKDTRELF